MHGCAEGSDTDASDGLKQQIVKHLTQGTKPYLSQLGHRVPVGTFIGFVPPVPIGSNYGFVPVVPVGTEILYS